MTRPDYRNTKQYAVFFCADYYPSGGLRDLVCLADSIEQAKEKATQHRGSDSCTGGVYDICDMQRLEIVETADVDWQAESLQFQPTTNEKEYVEFER